MPAIVNVYWGRIVRLRDVPFLNELSSERIKRSVEKPANTSSHRLSITEIIPQGPFDEKVRPLIVKFEVDFANKFPTSIQRMPIPQWRNQVAALFDYLDMDN